MKIKIIAVGKTKQRHWQLAETELAGRLRRYTALDLAVVKEALFDSLKNAALVKKVEGDAIRGKIGPREFVVALDPSGRAMTSEAFAVLLQEKMSSAQNRMTFLIGGSLGLDSQLVHESSLKLSLSKMTLPHELAKVLLLEQIYRAFTIIRGEKYHK